jgi:signal transduction histidine kinase
LRVLERDLDRELTRELLDALSSITRDTLADLRQLAVSVRPPSLDELGLLPALEGIVERERARRSRQITLRCEDCPRDLAPEVETCAYHVVEEAIQALGGPLDVQLGVDQDTGRLRIELTGQAAGEHEQQPPARLATSRARLELIGGTLQMSSNGTGTTGILAEVPLGAGRDPEEPQ